MTRAEGAGTGWPARRESPSVERLRKRLDAAARRLVPAVPTISRSRPLMAPLDALDYLVSLALGVAGEVPPNRLRIRVGAGNRLLFNQVMHREMGVGFWLSRFADGTVRADSRILDIGCGCGRYASVLAGSRLAGAVDFRGVYTGVDVDPEMIAWCRARFPADRFTFLLSPMRSVVYNPGGEADAAPRLDVPDASQNFVFSVSLFTHLLAPDVEGYLREAARVMAPGAAMRMTVFCLDDLRASGLLGGRWTFAHTAGPARLESERRPEAAVAYERAWLLDACARAGLAEARVLPAPGQSALVARAPSSA